MQIHKIDIKHLCISIGGFEIQQPFTELHYTNTFHYDFYKIGGYFL